jgi:hypothetical protein
VVQTAPVHRHAPQACRSAGQHAPPAAKTVRAATEQNSLLLSNQERLRVTPGSTMSNMRTRGRNVRRTADTALLREIAPGAWTAA